MPHLTHAVVLGAGVAGVLAAAALADFADRITVIERDPLPQEPAHRAGLPQARHAHLLWSGGVRAVDQLLPDTIDGLVDRGAHRINVGADFVCLTAHGWLPRVAGTDFAITCTRDLLNWHLLDRVRQLPQVRIRDGADVVGLTGGPGRVTGVQVHDRGSDTTEQISADLVVDATGRGSRAKQWLAALGVPGADAVREQVIDAGLTYVTRIFHAPDQAANGFPLVSVQTDVPTNGPGKSASLVPIEGSRWLVTLAGTRGHEPPHDEAGFLDFARTRVRHPVIADLVSGLSPATPIYTSHSTSNRRLYFERLRQWPDGFVVLADALATFNPIYGQGMSAAARTCLALRARVQSRGVRTGSGRGLQRAMARTVQGTWDMATGVDVFYPHAGDVSPSLAERLSLIYVNRVIRAAIDRDDVAAAFLEVVSLSAPPTRLASPSVLLAALRPHRGSARASAKPTLTDDELRRAFVDRPARGMGRLTASGGSPTGAEGADQHPAGD